ncbi:MAG TPA: hypothetical protein DEQ09_07295 [Bacteroidales bacterium]|nr:hypothetical protein [Bacteroidales bacterium]
MYRNYDDQNEKRFCMGIQDMVYRRNEKNAVRGVIKESGTATAANTATIFIAFQLIVFHTGNAQLPHLLVLVLYGFSPPNFNSHIFSMINKAIEATKKMCQVSIEQPDYTRKAIVKKEMKFSWREISSSSLPIPQSEKRSFWPAPTN